MEQKELFNLFLQVMEGIDEYKIYYNIDSPEEIVIENQGIKIALHYRPYYNDCWYIIYLNGKKEISSVFKSLENSEGRDGFKILENLFKVAKSVYEKRITVKLQNIVFSTNSED